MQSKSSCGRRPTHHQSLVRETFLATDRMEHDQEITRFGWVLSRKAPIMRCTFLRLGAPSKPSARTCTGSVEQYGKLLLYIVSVRYDPNMQNNFQAWGVGDIISGAIYLQQSDQRTGLVGVGMPARRRQSVPTQRGLFKSKVDCRAAWSRVAVRRR